MTMAKRKSGDKASTVDDIDLEDVKDSEIIAEDAADIAKDAAQDEFSEIVASDVENVNADSDAQDGVEGALVEDPEAPQADEVHDETSHDVTHDTQDGGEQIHYVETSGGFFGNVLKGVGLLAIGGALALWGAPKLVPYLPSGMSGLANFLTPGAASPESSEVTTEIAAQHDALEAQKTALSDLQSQVAEIQASAEAEGETAAGEDVNPRFDELTTRLDDIDTRLGALEANVNENGVVEASGASGLDEATLAQISALASDVEALKSENEALKSEVDAAQSAVNEQLVAAEEIAQESEAKAEEAIGLAEKTKAAAELRVALESGENVEAAAKDAEAAGIAVPEALVNDASEVRSASELKADFGDYAIEAIRAGIRAGSGETATDAIRGFLKSRFTPRSTTPQEGSTPDAILSRAEDMVRRDDFSGAIAEMEALPAVSKTVMQPWIDEAEKRIEAMNALQSVEAALAPAQAQ